MPSFSPKDLPTRVLHQYLVGAIAPRPIAFASTIDDNGQPNLAPYSFFNCFGSNPPTLVFSSNRTVANNTTKDTLHNVEATGEVVINIVNYDIVRQMAVASVSFPSDVSEFDKSGLTPVPSTVVKPFRVKESPVSFECKVQQIIPMGDEGGAAHLIICEVVHLHLNEAILDEEGRIDPYKIDVVGRMGRAFYTRAKGDIFKVYQPVPKMVIGFDSLPKSVQNSPILSGNDLGQLAGLHGMPTDEAIKIAAESEEVQLRTSEQALHGYAKTLIKEGKVEEALAVLLTRMV